MIQGENSVFELIRCDSETAWLKQRTKGVGGSDVAAIMGVSPFKSPLDVWLEKTGRVDVGGADSPYMAFGRVFEPIIGAWYKQNHKDMHVRRVNAICRSIERPWAQASLDYEIRDYVSNTWGVLEIKTARSARDWGEESQGIDGVPLYYQAQVLHYLSVTGREYAHLCVFFRDSCEYRTYLIKPDAKDLEAVNNAVNTFWHDYVEADKMPALVPDDVSKLADAYPVEDEIIGRAEDNMQFNELVEAYRLAAVEEKEAGAKKKLAQAELLAIIGENLGAASDVYEVRRVVRNVARFDTKAFKAAYPELYKQFTPEAKPQNGGIRIKEL